MIDFFTRTEKHNADLFHDHYVVKHFFAVWKRSFSKVKVSAAKIS